jgi:hypothetical protein
VVGKALLVQPGPLVVELSLGALPACLLLGDPRAPLGGVRPLLAALRLLTMLGDGTLPALGELAFPGAFGGSRAHPWQREPNQNDEDYDDHDDRDQQSG